MSHYCELNNALPVNANISRSGFLIGRLDLLTFERKTGQRGWKAT